MIDKINPILRKSFFALKNSLLVYNLQKNNFINLFNEIKNMAIIIGNKKYQGQLTPALLSQMINAVKQLPKPEVVPMGEIEINPNDVILCLQREMAYVNEFHSVQIRYLGTKNICSCIAVYIYSETDHLLIHFDYTKKSNLINELNQFNSKENLKVILIGGRENRKSETNLSNILTTLFHTADTIDIALVSQKLIEQNVISNENFHGYITDIILRRADIFYRHYFKKSLDLQPYLNKQLYFRYLDLPANNKKLSLLMQTTIAMLLITFEVYDISDRESLNQLDSFFKYVLLEKESIFLLALNSIFSNQGLESLKTALKTHDLYDHSDFVFDLSSKKVIHISEHLKSQLSFESHHELAFLNDDSRYFLCYDGKSLTCFTPTLSHRVLAILRYIQQELKNSITLDYKTIDKFFLGTNTTNLTPLIQFIKTGELSNYKKIPPMTYSFFSLSGRFEDIYAQDELCSTNLTILNMLSNEKPPQKNFFARKRNYPKCTLDALLSCNSKQEAEQVRHSLDEKNIDAKIIQFSNNRQYYVIVPAINVTNYAQPIQEQRFKYIID